MNDLFDNPPPVHFAISAAIPISPESAQRRGGFLKTYDVTEGPTVRRIYVATKREAWALDCLRAAGTIGCTPISDPAPRWSGYIHKLRRNHRLNIETVTEPHHGEFAGHHARYVLKSIVRPAYSDGGAS
jgi:hypothetical protein